MSLTATLQRTLRRTTPLSVADRETVAKVLTWDTQHEVSADEVETIAISHDILWVKLRGNHSVPIHVDTFRAIRHQQLEQVKDQVTEIPVLPPLRLEVYKTPFSRFKAVHSYKPGREGFTRYVVESNATNPPTCTCPDYSYRHRNCKHILAVNQATSPLELEPALPKSGKVNLAFDLNSLATRGNYSGLKAQMALRNRVMSVAS